MLAMRPNCERCGTDLPAEAPGAFICSFECTFCADCADALDHAEEAGWTLNTHADPTADARQDCTLGYAQAVAAEDPSLVWLSR